MCMDLTEGTSKKKKQISKCLFIRWVGYIICKRKMYLFYFQYCRSVGRE